ncbi:class I adenylate-forming enzyme family protein [Prescottella equi]|uniref:class I adenylate-forming enzyme family protein n=1 Tax=Rhodococcus hoagii TaxID=43767 RepID=UPI00301CD399
MRSCAEGQVDDLTIGGLLERAALLWPERTAYVHEDQRLTWSELAAEVDRYTRAFMAWGVQPGDRVSLWMGNTLSWILVELGLVRAGAVVVPVNTGFTVAETAYVVGQSDSVMLVAASTLRGRDLAAEALQVSARPEVSVRAVVSVGATQSATIDQDNLLAHADKVSPQESAVRAAGIDRDQIVLMLYTSGTTGFPKGVMHSHQVIGNMADAADRMRLCEQDVAVMYLPLFHIFAMAATVSFMARGASLVLMEVFEPGASLDLMESEGATLVYGVAPHYLDQIRHPSFSKRDLSSLRLCLSPGSADLVRIVSANMGPAISVYGMTETTSMTSLGDVDDSLHLRAETVGRTLPRSTVKVVDEHGNEVMAGVVGHLLVKGPSVMQGYYKMPEATAESIVDGWFRTGDAVSVDTDGYLRFASRIKEIYKVGGENVDPIEVESALMRHPAVAFASVQGVPDERLDEVGLAHVTVVPGRALDIEELRAYARQHLASFKVPRHIVVVDELPMTASGKVRKFILRDEFLAQ